jgi:small subunit ribosomal protein S20
MATHKSAEKRHRQSLKHRAHNRITKDNIKSLIRKAKNAATSKQPDPTLGDAATILKMAEKALAKAANRSVVHKKTAARKISRLAKAFKKGPSANAALKGSIKGSKKKA